jgi:hypothetical protein
MLTKEEFTALIQLLQRLPLSQAEILWINSIITKLASLETEETGPDNVV